MEAVPAPVVAPNPSALDVHQILKHLYGECSRLVWDEPKLRPSQDDAVTHIGDPSKSRYLVKIDKTSSGKTHTIRVAGVVEKGITLVIINLHALSADTMAKFTDANQAYGTVVAHNVDELYDTSRPTYNKLLRFVKRLPPSTSSTIFLFSSPQFLCFHPNFTKLLIDKANERVLRLVVVDEVHLHVQQGSSFRNEIRQLRTEFFKPVFDRTKQQLNRTPKAIFTTATMMKNYVPILEELTTLGLPSSSIQWATHDQYEQRNIEMLFKCSSNYTMNLNSTVEFLKDDQEHYACIFIGSKDKYHHLLNELERELNESLLDVDIMHVHGSLDKNKKYWFMRIFCAKLNLNEIAARVLLATAAGNVGIDNHLVTYVVSMGWPRDLCTYFQQRGRGGRLAHIMCRVLQIGSVTSYVFIVWQIHNTTQDSELDDDDNDVETNLSGLHSAVSPSRERRDERSQGLFPLTRNDKRKLIIRFRQEILDVIRFFVLDYGCQHIRGEWFMSCGDADSCPPLVLKPCMDKCPTCTGNWSEIFKKVHKDQVIKFLKSEHFQKMVPLIANKDNIVDVLWKGADKWRVEKIYGKKTVSRASVDGLFLQLIANEIIVLKQDNTNLVWKLGRTIDPENPMESICNYEYDERWKGMHLF